MEPTNPTPLSEDHPIKRSQSKRSILHHLPQGTGRLYTYRTNQEKTSEGTRGEPKVYHLFDDAEIQREVEKYRVWKEQQAASSKELEVEKQNAIPKNVEATEVTEYRNERWQNQNPQEEVSGNTGAEAEVEAEAPQAMLGEARATINGWDDYSLHFPAESQAEPSSILEDLQGFSTSREYRTSRRGWVKILLVSILALGLGSTFGYLLLQLFLQPAAIPHNDHTVPVNANGLTALSSQVPEEQQQVQQQMTEPLTAIQIAPLSLHMVQAGAFAEESSAQAIVDQLMAKGFQGVISDGMPYRLFVGVAVDQEMGLQLGRWIQNQGIEIYVKEYSIAGIETLSTTEQEDLTVMAEMLEESRGLLERLSVYSIRQLIEPSGQEPVGQADPEIMQHYSSYLQHHEIVLGMLPAPVTPHMEEMKEAMVAANTSYEQYLATKQVEDIWAIQRELVRYGLAYEQWIKALHQVAAIQSTS